MTDSSAPQTLRLFIALTLPEAVKTEIERAQVRLRRALPTESVRWSKREQFHLTLKFLGDLPAERVELLVEAVRSACRSFAALELSAERIGCFPDQRRPRVIWAGVHDRGEQLPRLQQAVEVATRDFSAVESNERFTGHVTLARIKSITRPEIEALAKLASNLSATSFGAWTADRIEIIRSQLYPEGARHTNLATIRLEAEA